MARKVGRDSVQAIALNLVPALTLPSFQHASTRLTRSSKLCREREGREREAAAAKQ